MARIFILFLLSEIFCLKCTDAEYRIRKEKYKIVVKVACFFILRAFVIIVGGLYLPNDPLLTKQLYVFKITQNYSSMIHRMDAVF